MKSFSTLAAALMLAPVAAAQNCEPYQKILEAVDDEFASIRGASVGDKGFETAPFTGMFETPVWLLRMASCRIIETKDLASYSCTNVMGVESAIRSAYDGSLADAKVCLKSWTETDFRSEGAPPDGFTPVDSYNLKGPDGVSYSLGLVAQSYRGRTFWRVTILFSVPRKTDAGA